LINHPKSAELNLETKNLAFELGRGPMPVELIGNRVFQKKKDMGIFSSEGYGLWNPHSLGISNPVLGKRKWAVSVSLPG